MYIRPMQTEDIEAVAELEKACFSQPWSAQAFREISRLAYRTLLVAIEDNKIVGECMLTDIAGEGEISNVAVDAGYRQRGIARELMKEALETGRRKEMSAYTLEVRAGNVSAIRLYESFGFITEGVRKNFYDKPVEDALIMWKH